MVLTRSKCQQETPMTLALSPQGSFLAAGLIVTALPALLGLSPETQAASPFLLSGRPACSLPRRPVGLCPST